jgi:hypothetical protein
MVKKDILKARKEQFGTEHAYKMIAISQFYATIQLLWMVVPPAAKVARRILWSPNSFFGLLWRSHYKIEKALSIAHFSEIKYIYREKAALKKAVNIKADISERICIRRPCYRAKHFIGIILSVVQFYGLPLGKCT